MGGALMAAHGARRHTTNEIKKLTPEIVNFLSQVNNIELHFQKEFRDKQSHGDLDILVGFSSFQSQSELTNLLVANNIAHSVNGRVSSFVWKQLQVDAIFIEQRRVKCAAKYFSWGDLGNILGLYAENKGLKLGDSGLYIEKNIPNVGLAKAFVSFDFDSALECLELPVNEFNNGFTNFNEVINFLSKSSIVPDLTNISSAKRRRMRVRPNQARYYESIVNGELGAPTPPVETNVSLPLINSGNIAVFRSILEELGTHTFCYSDLNFMAAKATIPDVSNIVLGKNYDGTLFLSMGSMNHQIETATQLKETIVFETTRQLSEAQKKREEKRKLREQNQC